MNYAKGEMSPRGRISYMKYSKEIQTDYLDGFVTLALAHACGHHIVLASGGLRRMASHKKCERSVDYLYFQWKYR